MEKLKHQLSNGSNYKNKQNNTENHQQSSETGKATGTGTGKTVVDIDFLHKVIFDINSKLDSNVYWLTTLLQNIILSIETLNNKAASLDKRLTVIENSKNNNENLIKKMYFENDKIQEMREKSCENFKLNSINDDDDDDDDNEGFPHLEQERANNVVLRRRTIQVLSLFYSNCECN